MAPTPVELKRGEFVELADECGLEIRREDLEQMIRRGIIEPLGGDQAPRFTPLHLYVVARYLEAVRPIRHPWGTVEPETTVDEVTAQARDLQSLLEEGFDDADRGAVESSVSGRIEAIDAFLERIDPFGPLTEVFELLKSSAISQMSNTGRLYAEIRAAKERLETAMTGDDEAPEAGPESSPAPSSESASNEEMPRTRELYDLEAPESVDEEEEDEARDVIDEVVSAADEKARESDGEAPATEEVEAPPVGTDSQPMQPIEVTPESTRQERLDEESSEPIVLGADDDGGDDGPGPSVPPPSPVERREKFEQRRQKLVDDEDWEAVATLFEEYLETEIPPKRRQRLLAELARITEVKLRDRDRAFAAFKKAWDVAAETDEGRHRAFEGIQRVGKSPGFHGRYLEWIREQLAGTLEPGERAQLHKELARGLFADQNFEEAFESFASYLLEAPSRHIDRDSLNQLDRLGDQVDPQRVAGVYRELGERGLDDETEELIEEFTAETA